jgi:hypothetical protein
MKNVTPRSAVAGFTSTGIYPFNPDILPVTTFAPSSVSERPLHCNVNRRQETISGRNNKEGLQLLKKLQPLVRLQYE